MMPSRSAPGTARRVARRGLRVLDQACDTLALSALTAMVLVVSWQVFGRYVLQSSPRWAPEVALVLLGWVGFLGIAIGVRERSHVAVQVVVNWFPAGLAKAVNVLGHVLMATFGAYLVVQGWSFTRAMARNTMPGTGLPRSVQYAAMPVAGLLVMLYALRELRRPSEPSGSDPRAEAVEALAQPVHRAGAKRDGGSR